MNWFQLKKSGFIDPFWFNKMKNGIHYATIEHANQIFISGEPLSIINGALEQGTAVVVRFTDGNFECTTRAEYENRIKVNHEVNNRVKRENEDINYNAELNIPVSWIPEIKHVISGLTENSACNGQYKKTVYHIMLLDSLSDGRLKRNAGDFLCTSKSGTNGSFYELRDSIRYKHKITCKACLRIAKKWK